MALESHPAWPLRGFGAMKCQKCAKAATLHITEILGEEQIEELHLCEECARNTSTSRSRNRAGIKAAAVARARKPDEPAVLNRECDVCGIKFVDFRNSGRLGCPHDYEEFRDELMPLLENIHGETQALRQDAAPPAAEQANAVRADPAAQATAAGGQQGGVRGGRAAARPIRRLEES